MSSLSLRLKPCGALDTNSSALYNQQLVRQRCTSSQVVERKPGGEISSHACRSAQRKGATYRPNFELRRPGKAIQLQLVLYLRFSIRLPNQLNQVVHSGTLVIPVHSNSA